MSCLEDGHHRGMQINSTQAAGDRGLSGSGSGAGAPKVRGPSTPLLALAGLKASQADRLITGRASAGDACALSGLSLVRTEYMRRLGLWEVVTACGLICSSTLVLGSSIDSELTLTVAAGGCTAFELNGLPQKFGYSETVDAWTLGTCAASTVR